MYNPPSKKKNSTVSPYFSISTNCNMLMHAPAYLQLAPDHIEPLSLQQQNFTCTSEPLLLVNGMCFPFLN